MSFPDDLFGLLLLVFAAVVILGAWMDRFSMGRKHDEEDRLKQEVKDWIEAQGRFIAVLRRSGEEWHWVVDPWNLPWTDTKWEIYYDEVFDTKPSGD